MEFRGGSYDGIRLDMNVHAPSRGVTILCPIAPPWIPAEYTVTEFNEATRKAVATFKEPR